MKCKGFCRLILSIFLICVAFNIVAQNNKADSVLIYENSIQLRTSIKSRVVELGKTYPLYVDTVFTIQVKRLVEYIATRKCDNVKKNEYYKYLSDFLLRIDKPQASNYFSSGRYINVLQFYAAIIDYNEQGRLLELLEQNKLLALKSIFLYRNRPEAYTFLKQYYKENPDEVIRNVDEFAETNYAKSIVLDIALYAPLSAERYLGGYNTVNRIIKTSDDSVAIALTRLDSVKVNRHYNFIFLEEVLKTRNVPAYAYTISNNKISYFKKLSEIHFSEKRIAAYSANRELSIIASEIIREINYYYSNGYKNNVNSILSSFTNEEMYLVFIYGYTNANSFSFGSYLDLLKEKKYLYSANFYNYVDNTDLEQLMKTADKLKKTNDILLLSDSMVHNKLLSYLTTNEDIKIDFASYIKDNINPTNSPVIEKSNTTSTPSSSLQVKTIEQVQLQQSTSSSLPITSSTTIRSQDETIKVTNLDLQKLNNTPIDATHTMKIVSKPISITVKKEEKYTYEILKSIDNTIGNAAYAGEFLDQPYSKRVLNTVASMHPDDIFRQVKNIQSKYWIKEILEKATQQSPVSYKRYLPNENHPVRYILNTSKDTTVLAMNNLYKQFGYRSNLYPLVDNIVNCTKTPECVDSLCRNNTAAFREMIRIITNKNCIGRYSIEKELESNSLLTIRAINDMPGVSPEIRYKAIKDYNAQELYVLMLYGEDELFKSSFFGLYQMFNERIGTSNTFEFLQSIDFLHFRAFLKILANFDKTEDFLNKMSADQRLTLIGMLVKNLEKEKYNPSEVIYVAEAIPGFKLMNDKAVINTMIYKEFERLQNENSGTGMLMYGLLASIIQKDAVSEIDWYTYIKTQFTLPNIDGIRIADLKTGNGVIVQQHYFYNDDDGKSSFNNFISTIKGMSNWVLDNHETYVQVTSTSGNKVILFANKPEYEQNGINDIQKALLTNQYTVSVIVHRGHSFHTEKTLTQIPTNVKLILVGSCGGYYKLPIAIERAPNSHIISTKQIGTMRVNDPAIKLLCEYMRNGKDIVWSDFWNVLENATGKNAMFYDYVPPNKNLGSLFLNAYYNAIDKAILVE